MSEREGSVVLFAAITLWVVGLLAFFWASMFAWGLRDGWGGPDAMIVSHGTLAIGRFWAGLRQPFVFLVLPAFVAGGALFGRWWRTTV